MARTKAGGRSRSQLKRNSKLFENGYYVHSSPPKAMDSNSGTGSATIREHIRSGDLEALEEVILQGQGAKLVNQPATDQKVRAFLKTVPAYMNKIDLVHDAAAKGNLRDLKALLDRRKLARSKDNSGTGLLHKAVQGGHTKVVDYLSNDYPESLEVTDNDGRTPLHYCAASKVPEEMYNILLEVAADPQVQDNKGKTAADYMANPSGLNVPRRRDSKKDSGGRKRRTPTKRSPKQKIKTPPKREGLNITGANIRIWIHDQDLAKLEQIVWEGQGHRLCKETSSHSKVRQFLNLVPRMMTKIKEVHEAAVVGNLEVLEAKADQPEILTAKDHNGLNPLHKAAALGHLNVADWILQRNQSAVYASDRHGRTPLHYSAVAKDGGDTYDLLLRNGADGNHMDKVNKTAEYYRSRQNELDISPVYEPISAPRLGGSSSLDVLRPSQNPSTNNSRSPSRLRSLGPSRVNSRRNSISEDKNQDRVRSRRNSNTELEYVDMRHVTDAEVDKMIHDGEENILWHVVYSGQGHKLQSKSAWNKDMRNFLKKVPGTQAKIKSLHEAAGEGNMDRVKQLTWENPKLAMARNREGATPLHFAARSGDVAVAKHLLRLYPDAINVADEDGRTPLHWAAAASEGNTSATYDFLSGEGGDTQMEDWEGVKPRDLLQGNQAWGHSQRSPSGRPKDKELDKEIEDAVRDAENDNYKAMTDIILRGDGRYFVGRKTKDSDLQHFLDQIPRHLESIEELHEAVEKGETRRVINLLDRKQKARTRDRNHANILHKAVLFGHTDLVRYLVTSFPDLLEHKDRAGRTPLHYAGMVRDGGHIYKILDKSGADNTVKDNKNHTPEDYMQNPSIMNQWDLKKELEEGIPEPEPDSRPYTKGSEAISYYGNSGDGVTHADEETLQHIDEAYNTLRSSRSRSLLKKYLTREVYDKIKDRVTPNGASLLDVINSGVQNPDSSIGIYAPDAESYDIFSELFDPVIDEYHGGFGPNSCHPGLNFGHPNSLGDLNKKGDFVVSTRVRCARSIEGYPFNPLLTNEHYAELEQDIVRALESLDHDLSGQYTPINRLSPKDEDDLLERHLLFKQGDRFLRAAGACRYWPDGRGIFLNDDSTLVVWVNEEDHMRIISMQPGGDLAAVYKRFTQAVTSLGQKLPFSSSQRLGFLTFCPTNLGTAIRASVHIRLPNLGEDRRILEDTADRFNLQVRGTSGEHSEAKDYVFDISNRRRLGLTEIEALQEMYDGVQEIINMEIQMSEGRRK